MAVGLVVGLVFFARPSTSELENRTLTPFPDFSVDDFLTGAFFTDVSLWYADTYPLREPMVHLSQNVKSLYGIQPNEAFYGGGRQSDELPAVGQDAASNSANADGADENSSDSTQQGLVQGGVAKRDKNAPVPDMQQASANLESQITSGVYMTDNACYTLYYFSQDACEEYCGVVNQAADLLDGIATVYSVIIPTNAGVMLDADLQKELGAANQEQAIDYLYSRMSDKVVPIETFDPLYEHRDEYLYFRTDHHWTQLGAYYVFENFCRAKGIEPPNYRSWEEKTFDGFLGAYYTEIGVAGMANHADSVVARIPSSTNDMYYWVDDLVDGSEIQGNVITDLADADPSALYQTFVCGNNALSMIVNPTKNDGSSCLIIKDSFGNPFTSVTVDSYQYVYTFDFRSTSQDLVSFVKKHNIQDVIIENAIMFAGTYDAAALVGTIVDGSNRSVAGDGPTLPTSVQTDAANNGGVQGQASQQDGVNAGDGASQQEQTGAHDATT